MKLLLAILASLLFLGPAVADDDYLAVFLPGGRLGQANYTEYTPAFAEFLARDYPGPIYLGQHDRPELMIIERNFTLPGWHPFYGTFTWSYDLPGWEISPLGKYHVPALVEFLEPGYLPPGINYSNYVPPLEEFARGSPKPLGYSQHVPALEAFLSESWQPQGPDPTSYPPWMTEYLKE